MDTNDNYTPMDNEIFGLDAADLQAWYDIRFKNYHGDVKLLLTSLISTEQEWLQLEGAFDTDAGDKVRQNLNRIKWIINSKL